MCLLVSINSIIITYTGIAASVSTALSRVCQFVRTLNGKRLQLSTPN